MSWVGPFPRHFRFWRELDLSSLDWSPLSVSWKSMAFRIIKISIVKINLCRIIFDWNSHSKLHIPGNRLSGLLRRPNPHAVQVFFLIRRSFKFRNRNEHGSIRLSGCNHVLAFARVNFCSASMRVRISSHEHARTVLLKHSHKLTRAFSSTSQMDAHPEAPKLGLNSASKRVYFSNRGEPARALA